MHWFEALFPFVPHYVFVVALAIAIVWLLLRWGDVIFAGYAIWYLCAHQWGLGVFCIIAAFFIALMKASWMASARLTGYRGPRV